jgi:hypothetical protein
MALFFHEGDYTLNSRAAPFSGNAATVSLFIMEGFQSFGRFKKGVQNDGRSKLFAMTQPLSNLPAVGSKTGELRGGGVLFWMFLRTISFPSGFAKFLGCFLFLALNVSQFLLVNLHRI